VDQTYFEDGYVVTGFFTYTANAVVEINSAFSPSFTVDIADSTGYYIPDYIAEGYVTGGIVREASAVLESAFSPSFTVDIADNTGYYIPDYIAE